jgi:phosphoenolpyruvate synthase/pyruvate phosphate dikinase
MSGDPKVIAEKYPWIEDGYGGVSKDAFKYFTERLKLLNDNQDNGSETKKDRGKLAKELGLTDEEVESLTLTRKLAEFMDDRKAWMMRTRRNVTKSAGNIEHGWLFDKGKITTVGKNDASELWERYIDFKASSSAVTGIVASNGGRHFINGEVSIVTSPTDSVADNRILVVPSTSPSYVPLMRKARALVTDHGGMMSHAAIVAREFNLPCIVGTKQGTKVLKNGDKVVLDLVRGEVSKL